MDIRVFDELDSFVKRHIADALHPLFGADSVVAEVFDEEKLGRHEDETVFAAVFEIDLAEIGANVDVGEAGFFANFASRGLTGSLALFDVAFRDSPAVFSVLDE